MDIGTAKPTPRSGPRYRTTASTWSNRPRLHRRGVTRRPTPTRSPTSRGRRASRCSSAAPASITESWSTTSTCRGSGRRSGPNSTRSTTVAPSTQRLESLDPAGAAKIEPTNRRRVVRALEVTLGSGRPFSSFGPGVDAYPPTRRGADRHPPAPPVLASASSERVHRMVDAGLVDEVRAIATDPGFSRTAAQALGYKEILVAPRGCDRVRMRRSTSIITRTRQFAVRQERWFRRDPRVRWIDVEHDPVADAVPAVIDALTNNAHDDDAHPHQTPRSRQRLPGAARRARSSTSPAARPAAVRPPPRDRRGRPPRRRAPADGYDGPDDAVQRRRHHVPR